MAAKKSRKNSNSDLTADGTPHRGPTLSPNKSTSNFLRGTSPAEIRAYNGNDFAERRLAAGLQSATTLPDNETAQVIDQAMIDFEVVSSKPVVNEIDEKRKVVWDPKAERARRRQEKIQALQATIFGAVRELAHLGVFGETPQEAHVSVDLLSDGPPS